MLVNLTAFALIMLIAVFGIVVLHLWAMFVSHSIILAIAMIGYFIYIIRDTRG